MRIVIFGLVITTEAALNQQFIESFELGRRTGELAIGRRQLDQLAEASGAVRRDRAGGGVRWPAEPPHAPRHRHLRLVTTDGR